MPIIDLIVPQPLGANRMTVWLVTLSIEIIYATYAVHQFSRLSLWGSSVRVSVVLVVGHGIVIGIAGLDRIVALVLPP